MKKTPVLLIILDGFGVNPSRAHNAWALAKTPHLDHYFATWPHTVLQASGEAVGLPDGQFGNSEVGHLTLGAGRVLKQELPRISQAIADDDLANNTNWQTLLEHSTRLHLVGLVSDGGVHSHIEHLLGLLPLIVKAGVEPVIHMVCDGRDTPPRSAQSYLRQVEDKLQQLGCGKIATISGRYLAMDRTSQWDRTEKAWSAMVTGQGLHADTAEQAIKEAYLRGETDEFIQATIIGDYKGITENQAVLFFNFRSDRIRQLTAAVGLEKFNDFDRAEVGCREVVCMTEYDAQFPFPVLFKPQLPQQVLAQVISSAGLKQFHCAETEKYPHVTYFFNGGIETPFAGESREIIPSPNVATYDLKPEMSAPAVADRVITAIESDSYQFVLVNFANTDMVGHTAVRAAVISAVETVDLQSSRIIQSALQRGWRIMLSADHGNCDEMVDPQTGQPHTQHTAYPVPCLLIGEPDVRLGIGRSLADVAPTILELLGLPQPDVMTGRSLLLR
ncbi:2,3-bisphosphoglycerate-independent phosphoglycerate mutase [Paraglaciecola arctica]|uniref:2,3-bisphosphoglycerate-independent phosphoglycerate mutase n=1 Tax=Paraglaciecola arctica BSs20135 TaxID=493475 RepID=K6YVJ2_9ALTE|nr:2,3-bisphosphoglycerate-independent phosphoglycerate mutase [Paraglaciecola arctica]GAC22197.1 2,3-bisphosphoglycerate-independent phosphoglycerate mutase [Paraglaciecola arctica BSs20135]